MTSQIAIDIEKILLPFATQVEPEKEPINAVDFFGSIDSDSSTPVYLPDKML